MQVSSHEDPPGEAGLAGGRQKCPGTSLAQKCLVDISHRTLLTRKVARTGVIMAISRIMKESLRVFRDLLRAASFLSSPARGQEA